MAEGCFEADVNLSPVPSSSFLGGGSIVTSLIPDNIPIGGNIWKVSGYYANLG